MLPSSCSFLPLLLYFSPSHTFLCLNIYRLLCIITRGQRSTSGWTLDGTFHGCLDYATGLPPENICPMYRQIGAPLFTWIEMDQWGGRVLDHQIEKAARISLYKSSCLRHSSLQQPDQREWEVLGATGVRAPRITFERPAPAGSVSSSPASPQGSSSPQGPASPVSPKIHRLLGAQQRQRLHEAQRHQRLPEVHHLLETQCSSITPRSSISSRPSAAALPRGPASPRGPA